MANFDIDFPEDFLSDLLENDTDELCITCLLEAAPILENEMKRALKKDNHELSGDLVKSIKATQPKKAKNGAYIVNVRPTGYSHINSYSVKGKGNKIRKYPVSNALKLIWIEYGVNGRQPAKPFLQKVINQTRAATMERMQEVYDRMAGVK